MAIAASRHLFLLRLSGDIGTKAKPTHHRFVQRLQHNLRDALAAEGMTGRVVAGRERVFAEADSPRAGAVLARVFGVQSLSPAVERPGERLEDVVRAGLEHFRESVSGRRFAVRARHVGDRSRAPFSAREIERVLGRELLAHADAVDLTHPEVTAHVELFRGRAYLFTDVVRAQGGLPIGAEGRAVALASGGFDSAVAAWLVQKRGVVLDYVFCNLGGASHQHGVLRVLKVLADRWSYGSRPRLHCVDFEPVAEHLRARTARRYWQVLLKRRMVAAADAVGRARGAGAIVTGEAIGQVSSQTLQNLAVIAQATDTPLLRPLVGFNKEEIIERARDIGTYELSAVVDEYCSMVQRRPATAAHVDAVRAEEAKLDPDVLERAVAERAVFDLRDLDLEKLEIPEIEIEHVPEGATVLDLRSRAAFRGWHYPGSLQLDFAHARRAYPGFDRDREYVLVCEIGLKSAHLAELMRGAGFRAHHFKGGLGKLLEYARSRRLEPPTLLDVPVSSD